MRIRKSTLTCKEVNPHVSADVRAAPKPARYVCTVVQQPPTCVAEDEEE